MSSFPSSPSPPTRPTTITTTTTTMPTTGMMTTILLSLALAAFAEGFQMQMQMQMQMRIPIPFPSSSLASRAAAKGPRATSSSSSSSWALFYSNGVADPQTESVVSPPPRIVFNGTTIVVVERETAKKKKRNVSRSATTSTSNSENESKPKSSSSSSKSSSKSKPKPSSAQQTTWRRKYRELLAFRQEHGHALVPQNYPPNPKLGQWIMAQRRQYTLKMRGQSNSLTEERMALLERVGFVWRVVRRGPRRGTVEETTRRRRYGHGRGHGHGHGLDDVKMATTMSEATTVENFEEYLIDKREEERWTEDELREAWRERFRILDQDPYFY